MKQDKQTLLTGASLAALTFFLTTQTAVAGQCYTMPSCETMGYNVTSCAKGVPIKCPFDTSKMKCVPEVTDEKVYCQQGYKIGENGTCVPHITIAYYPSTPALMGFAYKGVVYKYKEYANGNDNTLCKDETGYGGVVLHWRLPTVGELSLPMEVIVSMRAMAEMAGGDLFSGGNYHYEGATAFNVGGVRQYSTFSLSSQAYFYATTPPTTARTICVVTP